MTGLHHRFGWSISRGANRVELTVLAIGFLLGGTVGLGTVAFALGIGPIVQWSLGVFDPSGAVARRRRALRGAAPEDVPEVAASRRGAPVAASRQAQHERCWRAAIGASKTVARP